MLRKDYAPVVVDRNALIDDLLSMVQNVIDQTTDRDNAQATLEHIRHNLQLLKEGNLGVELSDYTANTIGRYFL